MSTRTTRYSQNNPRSITSANSCHSRFILSSLILRISSCFWSTRSSLLESSSWLARRGSPFFLPCTWGIAAADATCSPTCGAVRRTPTPVVAMVTLDLSSPELAIVTQLPWFRMTSLWADALTLWRDDPAPVACMVSYSRHWWQVLHVWWLKLMLLELQNEFLQKKTSFFVENYQIINSHQYSFNLISNLRTKLSQV